MKIQNVFYVYIFITILVLSCSRREDEKIQETILVRVGDRTISSSEFIRRAEYTIRPPYARGNTNIDKKRVINSLIAEKLLAMEASDDNELTRSEHFKRTIQGRQEQAMRQWLYEKEGVAKVTLDTTEIKEVYKLAGRKYQLQYLNVPRIEAADSIARWLNGELDIPELRNEFENLPEHEIEYMTPESDIVHQILYSGNPEKGQIFGPLKIDERQYLVMKIKGWTDRVAFSEQQVNQRVSDVKEKLTQTYALKIYSKFVADVMRGKRMELHPETFPKFAEVLSNVYIKPPEEKEEKFLDQTFKRNTEVKALDSLQADFEQLRPLPLLTYEGETWTVADFEEEFERHPLVFRKKNISQSEFPHQLRFAIADMLRDRELANVGYDRGYDNVTAVRRYTNMWRDAMLSLHQKQNFLKSQALSDADSLGMMKIIDDYLNPYIDELQQKYNDQIEVNVEEFEDIRLTRIDMFVTQQNVPFPIMVPSFPLLTTDYRLDYGKKMEKQQ
jgi:hypothetical protein